MSISRRNFIKVGALGAATLGVTGGLFSADKWLRPVAAENVSDEKTAYTFHPPNCSGRCSLKCTVREGKLVKIEPNEWPDSRHDSICLRGISEVERVYSPDRLKTPLKRVGERGEGKFVAISWDEALQTVADKFKESKENYGAKSILWAYSTGIPYGISLLPKLLGAQFPTMFDLGTDLTSSSGQSMVMGTASSNTNEVTDYVNSNMVILSGSNFMETSLNDAAFFYEAKEKGTKMVCIDPIFSTTAAKCDQWISIRPGTDSALFLGMIHLILNNKWYDSEYIASYSSSPFLIREDNKSLLQQEGTKKYLVWDQNSNSAQPADAPGILPALEGEYTVNGIQVKTVLTGFMEHVEEYTAKWASEVTEIPEPVIYELTKEYALGGPANIAWGQGGTDKYYHSDTTGRLGTILGGLTGNIGRIGGGVGQGVKHATSWSSTVKLGAWPLPPEFSSAKIEVSTFSEFSTKPNSVRCLFLQGNPIHQLFPNYNQAKKWVKSLEFVVAVDNMQCDSVNFADIVLPACTPFESEYDTAYLESKRNHILLQQKVMEPLFESKSDFQIEKELAKRLGYEAYLPKTPEDYVRAQLSSPSPALKGITFEGLLANRCVMRLNVPDEPYRSNMDHKFTTPSGRLEFYNEIFIEDNCAFPVWEEPDEATPSSPLHQKYPLVLGTPHTRFRVHSTGSNARWILQIDEEPRVRINPADAAARGIKNNDLVEVFNDRGSCQCKCQLANDMRPGMVHLSEGWWSRYFKKGDLQELINPKLNPRGKKLKFGPFIAYLDNLVEVKKVEG
ncbi:Dimethyl sulfoxide reductase DmsA [bioreactor metagenome]|uniref:Dimethyl sulfoxide reductase DmsA n=1 Tax=bioreactor metagenome TaxID=1076179 RepID=A0A644V9A8_9ZZZZ|nr:molybdopterin-dependent oxidoreductase [Desulfitobacterium hafniense]MEA5025805.1 molybdopterin-dependent oxidoreductase [Desulfitobacterium hafniense]